MTETTARPETGKRLQDASDRAQDYLERATESASSGMDRLADTATIVEETLQGIVNVKAFSNEGYELNRYQEGLGRFLTVTLRGARLRAAFIAFIIFALFGFIVLVLWSGARLLQQGKITFGDLTRFGLYTTFVAGAMGQFAELYSQLQKAIGATQRVRELLRETGEVEALLGPTPPSTLPRLRAELPADLHLAPSPDPAFELYALGLRPAEAHLLTLADGTKSVADLARLSELPERDALAFLQACRVMRVLDAVDRVLASTRRIGFM